MWAGSTQVSSGSLPKYSLVVSLEVVFDQNYNLLPLALNLIGPRAMDVLAELSYVSMTPEHFPSMFCKVRKTSWSKAVDRLFVCSFFLPSCPSCLCLQEMSVGYANGIRVMSMTHTGEPGFMLYIPIEVQTDSIQSRGQDFFTIDMHL